MLSNKEKEELLEDARSLKRRKEFAYSKKMGRKDSRSLDEFIRFLMSIQRVFSPFVISRKETTTRLNKL